MDLSDLVGKGVFRAWKDPAEFAKVYIDDESGMLAWPGGVDLAPDALYQEIAGVEQSADAVIGSHPLMLSNSKT